MVKFKGFEVVILNNERELAEFEIEDDDLGGDENTVTRYIEVVANEDFKIKFHSLEFFTEIEVAGIKVATAVDGLDVVGTKIKQTAPYHGSVSGRIFRSKGQSYFQKFRFAEVTMTENAMAAPPNANNLTEHIKNVGTILVKVYRLSSVTPSSNRNDIGELAGSVEKEYNEKLLKGRAVSHNTNYDEPKSVNKKWYSSVLIDPRDKPFLKFVFRYMSRDALQIMGAIPRPPSPVALQDRNVAELSREELIELVHMQNQNQAVIKQEPRKVKRERSLEDDDELSFLESRNVQPRLAPGELVDLTKD